MATLQEYCNTGDNSDYLRPASGYNYTVFQTFTPTVSFVPTSIKLLLRRQGTTNLGGLQCGICRVDSSGHASVPLYIYHYYSATEAGTLHTTNTWEEFGLINVPSHPTELGSALSAGTQYSIYFNCAQNGVDNLYIRYVTPSGYKDNSNCMWTSLGSAYSSWTQHTDRDIMFEIWGDTVGETFSGETTGTWQIDGNGKLYPQWIDPLDSTTKNGQVAVDINGKLYPFYDGTIGGNAGRHNGVLRDLKTPLLVLP